MDSDHETKKCPYCAEKVRAEASVCRFCGRSFVSQSWGCVGVVGQIILGLCALWFVLFLLAAVLGS